MALNVFLHFLLYLFVHCVWDCGTHMPEDNFQELVLPSTLWVPGNELRPGESAFIRWDILLALDSLWLLSKCFVVYDCSQRWVNLVFQKAQCAVQLLWANLWNGSRKPFLVHNKWHPNIFPVWAFRHQRRLDLFLKSCGYFLVLLSCLKTRV